RSRNGEVTLAGHGQGDGGDLLYAAAGSGNGDGVDAGRRAAAHRDGHGRVARTRRRKGLRIEADASIGRRSGGRERDGTVEAADESRRDGGSALVALRNGDQRGRRRESEAALGDGQGDGSVLLDFAASAGHGDGVSAQRRVAAHGDGHDGVTRAGRRNRVGSEAHRRARGYAGSREGNGIVEAAADRGGDGGAVLEALLDGQGRG